MTQLNKEKETLLKNKILEEVNELSVEELSQLEHVLRSIESSREGKLHYFGNFVGIRIISNELIEMDLGIHNANTYGAAQGGAIYTLADIAIGYSILPQLAKGQKVYTLELKMNYVKPGLGDVLRAKPTILHHGNKTVLGICGIYNSDGELVAQAQGTFYKTTS
jgi:uncharacterized protein (TIGR00369 family)